MAWQLEFWQHINVAEPEPVHCSCTYSPLSDELTLDQSEVVFPPYSEWMDPYSDPLILLRSSDDYGASLLMTSKTPNPNHSDFGLSLTIVSCCSHSSMKNAVLIKLNLQIWRNEKILLCISACFKSCPWKEGVRAAVRTVVEDSGILAWRTEPEQHPPPEERVTYDLFNCSSFTPPSVFLQGLAAGWLTELTMKWR